MTSPLIRSSVSPWENETPRFRGVSFKREGVFGAGALRPQHFILANRYPLLPKKWAGWNVWANTENSIWNLFRFAQEGKAK